MNYDRLEQFRRRLLHKRLSLLNRRRHAQLAEQELLAEREPDWEDAAALETAASLLEGLSESERLALARVQASLDRMADGSYGECTICHCPIDEDRLRALPDADRCAACAPPH